jgi:hypothetical protein
LSRPVDERILLVLFVVVVVVLLYVRACVRACVNLVLMVNETDIQVQTSDLSVKYISLTPVVKLTSFNGDRH